MGIKVLVLKEIKSVFCQRTFPNVARYTYTLQTHEQGMDIIIP